MLFHALFGPPQGQLQPLAFQLLASLRGSGGSPGRGSPGSVLDLTLVSQKPRLAGASRTWTTHGLSRCFQAVASLQPRRAARRPGNVAQRCLGAKFLGRGRARGCWTATMAARGALRRVAAPLRRAARCLRLEVCQFTTALKISRGGVAGPLGSHLLLAVVNLEAMNLQDEAPT